MDNSTANANSFLIIFFTASNGISVFVCLLAAVLVFILALHRNVVYRLALYQVLAALALATVEVLEIIFINDSENKSSGCMHGYRVAGGLLSMGEAALHHVGNGASLLRCGTLQEPAEA